MTIDTANRFMVGTRGEKILVLLPPTAVLSRVEALTLAAWLVANADTLDYDAKPDFDEILVAVRNS